MTLQAVPLQFPESLDTEAYSEFGREIRGVDVAKLSEEEFKDIEQLVYKHGALLFRDCKMSPQQHYELTKRFEPSSESYGHGNGVVDKSKQSLLNSLLKTLPDVPQVNLIGNGVLHDHEGIAEITLKHPSHKTFHKTHLTADDEEKGITRFYRWHMDAALYGLAPPKVTLLYGRKAPAAPHQTCRYDDGTGDELKIPLGATAFVSGKVMFDILPPELKSLAVRTRIRYAPHPFIWMSRAHAMPTGLGIETEGLEVPYSDLPEWEESKVQVLPMVRMTCLCIRTIGGTTIWSSSTIEEFSTLLQERSDQINANHPAAGPSTSTLGVSAPPAAKKNRKRKRPKNPSPTSDSVLWHTPWMRTLGMTEYESNEQRLHDEIVAYVAYCDPIEQETRARAQVLVRAEELIRRRFATCDIQLFGSSALDLCLPDSDIDLAVKTPLIYDDKYKVRALLQLSSMFRNASFCTNAPVAVGARVPVLQFETFPTLGSFNLDININADDGVKAIPIMKECLISLPPLRHLLLVLKGFLLKRGLGSASNGGLSSYGVACMIICFLKLNPRGRPQEILTGFMPNEGLGILLMDFLEFFGTTFDWTTSCVSPSRGETPTKESLGYANKSFPAALSIDCLVNPGRDVGRSATKATQIKAAFEEAHETLQRYTLSMDNDNILGTIVGISQKTSDRREHIRHLVDSGELETNLNALQLPASWSPPATGQQTRHHGSYKQRRDRSHSGGYYNPPAYSGGYPPPHYNAIPYAPPGTGAQPYGQTWTSFSAQPTQYPPLSYPYAPPTKRPRIH
ncbi:hypothetical protein EIP91_011829 [Steccherinum ochraceum]|uniref:polynucleotide adenylyltransferase n=1 Tax=Steccherinum ochraceum TaxID=92696 RepID=A0A4R0RP62_9APHY|nr:hypothetical protein EIP91_011829 [Steccherinum ochraceum]